MAEFTEVMRQARRLCAANGGMCSARNCPLDNGETCRLLPDLDGEDYNELERIIMGWAAEHPELVYPSWEDGWRQIFPRAITVPCINLCAGIKCTCHDCSDCGKQPIPAEVAEKLGIKPITKEHAVKHNCDNCKYTRRKSTDEPCVRCNHCIDCEESVLTAPDLWEAADKNVT